MTRSFRTIKSYSFKRVIEEVTNLRKEGWELVDPIKIGGTSYEYSAFLQRESYG